jgi:hypothetical protein
MNAEGFRKYIAEGAGGVEGWVADGIWDSLWAISNLQQEIGIFGGALEIGVHHGKFIIALSWLLRGHEQALAIDVFEKQWMNVDGSGSGSLERLKENWSKFANPEAMFSVITMDSLSIGMAERLRILTEHGAFRLISVDGGHTVEHVINDLLLCHELAAEGAVVLLDDMLNPHWPGVHEGFGVYMRNYAPKLRPFAITDNKLYLSSITFAERYLQAVKNAIGSRPSFKMVKMHGWNVIAA